ncbi:hypothetical protein HW35_11115 [Bacillus sp. X1(2014)]|jgi:hypothetical protein|nr:hypothetical protein HW35_11115 [Bacillus sp. X1(2014)]
MFTSEKTSANGNSRDNCIKVCRMKKSLLKKNKGSISLVDVTYIWLGPRGFFMNCGYTEIFCEYQCLLTYIVK